MAKIFISYRKLESKYPAGMIYDALARHFGPEMIFRDSMSILPGYNYDQVINRELEQCQIMLVLIGWQWLTLQNDAGIRRLDAESDWVRYEIETALKRGIALIPVLLDDARLPKLEELPHSIRELTLKQTMEFREGESKQHCQKIIDTLERIFQFTAGSKQDATERIHNVHDSAAQRIVKEMAWAGHASGSSPFVAVDQAVLEKKPEQASPEPVQPKSASDTKPNTDTGVPTEVEHRVLFQPGDRPLAPLDWELKELLGRGGFGEVWKAVNPHMPGLEPVALKFCTHPSAKEYFQHESALISTVTVLSQQHQGFVELLDTHLHTGVPCLKYRYYSGGTLSDEFDLLRPGDFIKLERVHQIMLELCETMATAHECRLPVVHRDLKPSNILRQVDHQKRVKLRITDFGISQFAARIGLEEAKRAGQLLRPGAYTALYASPQQQAQAPADPRDDVFALGVIWFQLFISDRRHGVPSGDDWKRYLQEQRKVPAAFVQILSRCIDSTETARPRNARELHRLISHQLEQIEASQKSSSTGQRPKPGGKPAPPKAGKGDTSEAVLQPVQPETTQQKPPVPTTGSSSGTGLGGQKVVRGPLKPVTRTRKPGSSRPALIMGGSMFGIGLLILLIFSSRLLSQPALLFVLASVMIVGVIFLCAGVYQHLNENDPGES